MKAHRLIAALALLALAGIPWGRPALAAQACPGTWSAVPTPSTSTASRLNGVAFASRDDGWAVGTRKAGHLATLTEHWNGSSWTIVPSPNASKRWNVLLDVSAAGPRDVWAVGADYDGGGMAMHWNGVRWRIVPTPKTNAMQLVGVTVIATDDAWAVGNVGKGIEHWDGRRWSVVPGAAVSGSYRLNGVDAISISDIWAVGLHSSGKTSEPETLAERWNGAKWVREPMSFRAHDITLYDVSVAAPDDAWAVGYVQSKQGAPRHTLTLHWDGSAWTKVPSPNVGAYDNRLLSVAAIDGNHAWAVGWRPTAPNLQGIRTLVLRWNGTSWKVVSSPNVGPGANVLSSVAAGPDATWAVGKHGTPNGSRTLALRSCH